MSTLPARPVRPVVFNSLGTLFLTLLVTSPTWAQTLPPAGAPAAAPQTPAPAAVESRPAAPTGEAAAANPAVPPAATATNAEPTAQTAEAPAVAEAQTPLLQSATAAAQPPPSAASENLTPEGDQAPTDTTNGWPKLKFYGRVMAGYEIERFHPAGDQAPRDETEQGFFLKQARVGVDAEIDDRVEASLSFDLDSASLRNAYLNVRMQKALQLRAGHFKRPFSRLANRGVGSIPFRSRGLFDKLILEDQNWGDRALGAMLYGRPLKAVRYYAAVMSPAAIGADVEGADAIGRVELAPVGALSIGLAGAHKWTERFGDGPNLSLNAVAADVKIETQRFYAAAELDLAQNPNPPAVVGNAEPRTPWAMGVLGYATYTFTWSSTFTLGPVGVLEWMDTDLKYAHDERVRAVLGMLLGYRDSVIRVMPQVEITRPVGKANLRGAVAGESYYVLLSTEI